jgi:peroxiredoxin
LGFALAACGGAQSSGAQSPKPEGGAQDGTSGATATDFALDDVKGNRFQLSDHLGKEVILLDFWATWCDPCKAEMPHLVDIYKKNKDKGLLMVAISMDGPESLAQVRGDAQQLHIPFPVVLDAESRVVASYNPRRSAPYSVLIDRKGHVAKQHDGYTAGDEVHLAKEIDEELAK